MLKNILSTVNEHSVLLQTLNGTTFDSEGSYRYRQALEVKLAWEQFFGPAGLGPMPPEVQYYCCAQFLVTSERIQHLPREFYLQVTLSTAQGRVEKNCGRQKTS